MLTPADKRAAFRKLHESGCFIIPNPFDVGSAKALQHLGFKALASTSAGFAWTIGKPDIIVTMPRDIEIAATGVLDQANVLVRATAPGMLATQ